MSFKTALSRTTDWIIINNLSLTTTSGPSQWSNKPNSASTPQPTLISLAVPFSIALAGGTDHLPHSIHYGTLSKLVAKRAGQGSFGSSEELAVRIAETALAAFEKEGMQEVQVVVEKPKALLLAASAGVRIVRRKDGEEEEEGPVWDQVLVKGLELTAIIGIHPWEREMKQRIVVDLTMDIDKWEVGWEGFDVGSVVKRMSEHVLESSYLTVEALITSIAEVALQNPSSPTPSSTIHRITVNLSKPSALMFADAPEIIITRAPTDFASPSSESIPASTGSQRAVAAIAFGSNVGDRFVNIERALRMLEARKPDVELLETSFLYESTAMYVLDQRDFVNGAVLISTTLQPLALLSLLKEIEAEVGRKQTFRYGPRTVDLDLIFYDELVYSSEEMDGESDIRKLVVPHERVHEREFVLRPLADMIPHFVHPGMNLSVETLLRRVTKGGRETTLRKVMPFVKPAALSNPSGGKEEEESPYWVWGERTRIMAVVNTTPDSFSDGGDHASLSDAMKFVDSFIVPTRTPSATSSAAATPVTIERTIVDVIDIGGYSTRPGAQEISPEEEISRVVPLVKAIRSSPHPITASTLISVDTFRGSVAKAALDAGADVVNDVYALTRERNGEILDVVKDAGCPVVMMHSRGDAGQDKEYDEYGGVVEGIRVELGGKVQRALDAGVRRWNVMVDPGLGFSKTVEGNLIALRDLRDMTASKKLNLSRSLRSCARSVHPLANLPVLVGSSRKSYLGKVIDRDHISAKERDAATVAAHTAAILGGAEVVRMHDAVGGWDGVQVADGLWRKVRSLRASVLSS